MEKENKKTSQDALSIITFALTTNKLVRKDNGTIKMNLGQEIYQGEFSVDVPYNPYIEEIRIISDDLKRIEELEHKLKCRNHEIRVLKKKLKGKMKDE